MTIENNMNTSVTDQNDYQSARAFGRVTNPPTLPPGQHYHDENPEYFDWSDMSSNTLENVWGESTLNNDSDRLKMEWIRAKRESPDAVHLLKIGRFYEAFHMDADVLVAETRCIYMRGSQAHTGFPDTSLTEFTSILDSKGYGIVILF
tara:strand:+ start:1282 stop:1725 length:444 start_codon:yes stop_codon:yes gene_type:complete